MFETVSYSKAINKGCDLGTYFWSVLITKVRNGFRADVQSNIIKFLNIQEQACLFYDESLCMYVQLLNKKYKPLLIKPFVDSVVYNSSLSKAQKLFQLAVWCVGSNFAFDLNAACFNGKQENEVGHNSCKCSCIPDGNLWNPTILAHNESLDQLQGVFSWSGLTAAFELQTGCDVIELLHNILYILEHYMGNVDDPIEIGIEGRRKYESPYSWEFVLEHLAGVNYPERLEKLNEDTISRVTSLCQHLALKKQDLFEARLLHGLLVIAALRNFKPLVPLLLGAGAGKYESSSSSSAVLTAAELGHHEVLWQLLNAGVDPNGIWILFHPYPNHNYFEILTPLQAAKRRGHQMCIQILRDYGAQDLESEELCVGIYGFYIDWSFAIEKLIIAPSTETMFSIGGLCREYEKAEMDRENIEAKIEALNLKAENAFMYHRLRKRAKGNPKSKRKRKGKRKFTAKSGGRRLGGHFQFYQTEIRLMNEELGDQELRFLNYS